MERLIELLKIIESIVVNILEGMSRRLQGLRLESGIFES